MQKLRSIVLLLTLFVFACGVNDANEYHDVEYFVRKTMAGRYDLWFSDADGHVVKLENLFGETSIPLKMRNGSRLYLKVVHHGHDGCVFAEIRVDGDTLEQQTTCGPMKAVELEDYL